MNNQRRLTAAVAALAATATMSQAKADAVADFYKGKQVAIQVGFGAGGGMDTTARIWGRHLGKYIPGNPSVIVQNVPGGGSAKLASRLYNATPNNGLTMGLISSAVAIAPLWGKRKMKFDTLKFTWIGSLHRDIMACGVWNGAGQGIKTLHDLLKAKKPVIFGSSSPNSQLSMFPAFLKNVFGANVRVIHGYRGTKPISLAMQKGEVNGSCGMYESSVRGAFLQSYQSGQLNLFMQVGENKTVPFFGNATPIFSLLKTEEQRKMGRLLFGHAELTRPIAAPPGVPKARRDALRKALVDTMKDPGLIKDGKRINTTFTPISGEKMDQHWADYFKTPRDLVEKTWKAANVKRNPRKKKK